MIKLTKTLNSWGSPEFEDTLKHEIENLDAEHLPLQQGLTIGSYALDKSITVMILNASDEAVVIRVKLGIFYCGIITGCSCADDPTPNTESNEYCEVQIDIDKNTAVAQITIL